MGAVWKRDVLETTTITTPTPTTTMGVGWGRDEDHAKVFDKQGNPTMATPAPRV